MPLTINNNNSNNDRHGTIQHGDPTSVCRIFLRSPPSISRAETPKSAMRTLPPESTKMLEHCTDVCVCVCMCVLVSRLCKCSIVRSVQHAPPYLDVSVNVAIAMEVVQCLERLLQNTCNEVLILKTIGILVSHKIVDGPCAQM